ncbi:MAG TPA: MDR family MFS transporter [Burkholderiales bacterium]|nr:MDR family MFS transporter [Burkholderiales bacterium]
MPTPVEVMFRRYGARYRWYAAGTMMLGTFSMVLAATIVNVAFPDIMTAFGLAQDTVQWLATGFLAAMSGTMLMTAWCVRRFGQRNTYVAALLLFVVASVAGGLAARTEVLIASRIAQGAVGGLIQPLAMITIFAVFPPDQRGRAMGLYGFGVVLAPAIGPAVGGWLTEHFGWRAIFFLPVPFCALGALLAPKFIVGQDRRAERPGFDWLGMTLMCLCLAVLLVAFNQSHRSGFTSVQTVSLFLTAFAAGAAFLWWESRQRHPLLDLGVFGSRQFAAASLVSFTYGFGLYGTTYLVPLFVQTVARYTPTDAGTLLTPAGIALACVLPLAGWWTDRMSPRHILLAGLALFALSSALFVLASPTTRFWWLAAWLLIGRVGLAMIIPALNAGALEGLPVEHVGQGSGVVNFIRQLGGAFGVNLLATLLEWRSLLHRAASGDEIASRTVAFHESFAFVALIFLLAAIPAWRMRREGRSK